MGEMIEFATRGSRGEGYLTLPAEGHARGRGVVLIHEWWGLTDHIKAIADRLAREGFGALAPDLYHGEATKSPDEAGKLIQ